MVCCNLYALWLSYHLYQKERGIKEEKITAFLPCKVVNVALDQGFDTMFYDIQLVNTMAHYALMHVLLLSVELAAVNTCFRLLTLRASGSVLASLNFNAFLEKWVFRGSQF